MTVLAAATLAAGCGAIGEEIAERAAEEAVGGDVEVDDEGNITVETSEGAVAIGAQELPDDLPDELPIVDDLEVVSSFSQTTDGARAVTFQAVTTQSFEDVQAFYAEQLEAEGWTITGESEAELGGVRTASWEIEGHDREGTIGVTQLGEDSAEDAQVSLLVSVREVPAGE